MIIRKDNDKKALELTEKELIIYGIFKDKHINRDNILSSFIYNENMLIILCKGNRYIYKNITNIKLSNREGIYALINEINKENLLFYPNEIYSTLNIIVLFPIYLNIIFLNNNNIIIKLLFAFIYVIALITTIRTNMKHISWVYNIDNEEFQKRYKNNVIISIVHKQEIKAVKVHDFSGYVSFKSDKYKIKMPMFQQILYPMKYKQILKEIELK